MTTPIKTIGHSNHPIERFVELLKRGGVDELVDVRSTPYSRRFPQFGRERLEKALGEAAAIEHLLADGSVRPHREVEEAVLGKDGGDDLFEDRAGRLARAYEARSRKMWP